MDLLQSVSNGLPCVDTKERFIQIPAIVNPIGDYSKFSYSVAIYLETYYRAHIRSESTLLICLAGLGSIIVMFSSHF